MDKVRPTKSPWQQEQMSKEDCDHTEDHTIEGFMSSIKNPEFGDLLSGAGGYVLSKAEGSMKNSLLLCTPRALVAMLCNG
ncbi:unnamed protein product [Protopolystoma xenopodis]|uniref:Uncharacterized protein n=1 Tax=Protopolystoma xenopodis TaxID=117903 RepID=A0A3S5BLC8_9PLAT|nr:unnamed protein product [Protopolystoma xenopodis]